MHLYRINDLLLPFFMRSFFYEADETLFGIIIPLQNIIQDHTFFVQ